MLKKKLSYTQMTLRALREQGRICDKAEKFNAYAGPFGRREDLFGFIDIVSLGPGQKIIGIQSTGPSGFSTHKKAILENEFALEWLKAGGYCELWSWRKLLKKRGGKLRLWTAKVEQITIEDFEAR